MLQHRRQVHLMFRATRDVLMVPLTRTSYRLHGRLFAQLLEIAAGVAVGHVYQTRKLRTAKREKTSSTSGWEQIIDFIAEIGWITSR